MIEIVDNKSGRMIGMFDETGVDIRPVHEEKVGFTLVEPPKLPNRNCTIVASIWLEWRRATLMTSKGDTHSKWYLYATTKLPEKAWLIPGFLRGTLNFWRN